MLKKGDFAIIRNHETKQNEIGKILKKWRREETNFYSIKAERGPTFDGITGNPSQTTSYVNEYLSEKYNQKLTEK